MQLTNILLSLVATTMVSGLTIPSALSLRSLDQRATLTYDQILHLIEPAENKAESEANGLGGGDTQKRKAFTEKFVNYFQASLSADLKTAAVVVCNVGYTFEGTEIFKRKGGIVYGADGGYAVTYDVLIFNKGKFTREGDGGYQNWAAMTTAGVCSVADNVITCP